MKYRDCVHCLILIFITCLHHSFAQKASVATHTLLIDSLQARLQNTPPNTKETVGLLNALADVHLSNSAVKSLQYARQALAIANQLRDKALISTSLNQVGEYYLDQGEYKEAFRVFFQSLSIGDSIQNQAIKAASLYKLGVSCYHLNQYDIALSYQFKALQIAQALKNNKETGAILSNISFIYARKHYYAKALEYQYKALEVRKTINDQREVSKSLDALGNLHLRSHNYPQALKSFEESLKISQQLQDKKGVATAWHDQARVYTELRQYERAKELYFDALRLKQGIGFRKAEIRSLRGLGQVFLQQKNYKKALHFFNKALNISRQLNTKREEVQTLNDLGYFYAQQGNHIKALKFHQQALNKAFADKERFQMMETYQFLYNAYLRLNDQANFARFYKLHQQLTDSLGGNRDPVAEIKAMQEHHEKQKKEKEVVMLQKEKALLKKQNELQKQKLKRDSQIEALLLMGLLLVIVIATVLYNNYHFKHKANQQLRVLNSQLQESQEELHLSNSMKDRLFSVIAHDLRSPLNTVSGFLNLMRLQKEAMTPEEIQELTSQMINSVKSTLDLLDNLLHWSRSQMGLMKMKVQPTSLPELVDDTFNLLALNAQGKKIELVKNLDASCQVMVDAQMIDIVIRNLVSNAIKFTNEGSITVHCQAIGKHQVEVTVQDTGVGLAPEDARKLFKVDSHFTTDGTHQEKGTGLGLLLCKELVEKNGGKIWVESEQGKGSSFKFILPGA
ncbi:tetratricopeptide repeat protein [uncultured Microscilla sp.]|uniref:ATP-binding protein n=1 Tax=uncultured Microscilla sp. TaxID=432653 RepID=UPI00262106B8|nr:tetratricopeptide repeat protein [uncultured Microscilla sp.]